MIMDIRNKLTSLALILILSIGIYGQTISPAVMMVTGPSTIVVPCGGDLQSAINAAQPGDRIVLEAGCTYSCSCVLPVKSGTEFITIESSRYAEIPIRGFFSRQPTPEVSQMMAKVRPFHSTEPSFKTAPGAHYYKLLGLDLAPLTGPATRIVEFGTHGEVQDTPAEIPHNLVIDKSWIHAEKTQEIQRCVALNSASTDITNSWITECHGRGFDTQAIGGWNGPGPYNIINNYLAGAGENVMFGGAEATVPGLVPTGIKFLRNFVEKPLSWYVNDPSYAGIKWTVKNLFELKNARDVLIDGNVFDGNWTDAQAGRAIAFTPRPSDSGVWAVVEDVVFQNNIVRNVGSGINLNGADEPPAPTETRLRRVKVVNDVFEIDGPRFASNGAFATVTNKTEDVTFEHNTVIQTNQIVVTDYAPNTRFIFRNNINRHNDFGIFGSGVGIGNPAIQHFFPGAVVTGNVIAKEINAPANVESIYPAGNFFPSTMTEVVGDDYRVLAAWKGKGTDGKDPGVDIDALNAAQGGRVEPSPSPRPDESADGTTGTKIVDSDRAVWTLGTEKQTLRNGVQVGGGQGSIYKYLTKSVYVKGNDSNWYQWAGTSWLKFGAQEPGGSVPVPSPTPTPSPTPVPSPVPRPVEYEVQYPAASSDEDRKRVISSMAVQGWICHPNPSGKFVICHRPKQ
ncbi:MAG TPA: hypothetical protein VF290_18090 [Pyrinomonadaceae bacterium]